MEKQKRAVAIHDISCIGKCSLTVALPVLSAAGIECSVIPTSVLSSHTGDFIGYTFRDLGADILPILDHWGTLDLHVDAIYTGYLGSTEQTRLMEIAFNRLSGPDTLIFVDPVMGDNGKLYAGFDSDFPAQMAALCRRAHVIAPNITEASFLLGEPYFPPPHTSAYIKTLIRRLSEAFAVKVALTGVQLNEDQVGAASFDPADGVIRYCMRPHAPGRYHGTGDLFGSAFLSGLLSDLPLHEAAALAVAFVSDAIAKTPKHHDLKYGVRFEAALPGFMQALGVFP